MNPMRRWDVYAVPSPNSELKELARDVSTKLHQSSGSDATTSDILFGVLVARPG